MPAALARALSVVKLTKTVKFVCIWNSVGIDANCVGSHLDVGAFGEDNAVM